MYKKELEILKKKNRFRKRKIYENLIDFASNDYLGLTKNEEILDKTYNSLKGEEYGAKASQLVNGYTEYHQMLEEYLCEINEFEAGMVVGSGFLANLAVFESLARRGDLIVLDEEYHASGIVGTKLSQAEIRYFKHNNLEDLIYKLADSIKFNRVFVAVEGVYSMKGDLVKREILEYLAAKKKVTTIIDEAHSVGVVGNKLMGVTDLYGLPTIKTIKIGTLGKALGSYGAYILARKEIISFLENRAKPVIYSTALSNFDTMYAYFALKYIHNNLDELKKEIEKRKKIIKSNSLIFVKESKNDIMLQFEKLKERGVLVGAIRPPTTKKPLFRVTARISEEIEKLKEVIEWIEQN